MRPSAEIGFIARSLPDDFSKVSFVGVQRMQPTFFDNTNRDNP